MPLGEPVGELRHTALAIAIAGLFATGAALASPGDPLGPIIDVGADEPTQPSVASDAAGEFVVVWRSQYAQPGGIDGRLFAADGTPAGPVFAISDRSLARMPRVAMNASGAFVVTWVDDSGRRIMARRFAAGGQALGAPTTVANLVEGNSYTVETAVESAVAIDDDGDFTLAWSAENAGYLDLPRIFPYPAQPPSIPLPGVERIAARAYRADGQPKGPAMIVDARPAVPLVSYKSNKSVAVAMNARGESAVIWSLRDAAGINRIYGRRYRASGLAAGLRFRVDDNDLDGVDGLSPAAAMNASGTLAVSWLHAAMKPRYASHYQLECRVYAPDGGTAVPPFDPFAGVQAQPSFLLQAVGSPIAIDASGRFSIATYEGFVDSGGYTVSQPVLRLFAADGSARSGKLALGNSGGRYPSPQSAPGLALDGAGNPIAVWLSFANYPFQPYQLAAQRLAGN